MEERIKKSIEERIGLIAKEAVFSISGVSSLCNNAVNFNLRFKEIEKGIYLLQNNNELVFDVYINVVFGSKIPQIAFSVQESIKKSIENNTSFKVDRVNIHVQGIDFN